LVDCLWDDLRGLYYSGVRIIVLGWLLKVANETTDTICEEVANDMDEGRGADDYLTDRDIGYHAFGILCP
jgi:hypothetical protein